jgi:uncharacterized protein YgbK (DUF1537 family)
MDVLDIPLALAAPAFPANRSLLENGKLSNGTDALAVFANSKADGTKRKTESIPLETVRMGANAIVEFISSHDKTQVFVADAVTDHDLEIIYNASTLLARPHILAGSAGLANQMALSLGKAGAAPPEKPAALAPALIIAGTRQGETAAQINKLCEFPAALVRFDTVMAAGGNAKNAIAAAFNEASRRMKQNSGPVVIAVDRMFVPMEDAGQKPAGTYAEGDETSAAICEALGVLTEKLMTAFSFPMLLTTGGDTSLAVCRHLGISAIEPLSEICPGIPLGRVTGGPYDGRFIVTKSGRFGTPTSILEIINWGTK